MPPTPAERQALLFLAAVALLGTGVRAVRAMREGGGEVAAQPALERQLAAAERVAKEERAAKAVRGSGGGKRRKGKAAKPAAVEPAGPVDVDRADTLALDALPGVGPALARRIVADREARGPFGRLEALDEVPGIGAALLARLAPHVTFSAPPRPLLGIPPAVGRPSRRRAVPASRPGA